jgi:hypothetical protein
VGQAAQELAATWEGREMEAAVPVPVSQSRKKQLAKLGNEAKVQVGRQAVEDELEAFKLERQPTFAPAPASTPAKRYQPAPTSGRGRGRGRGPGPGPGVEQDLRNIIIIRLHHITLGITERKYSVETTRTCFLLFLFLIICFFFATLCACLRVCSHSL